MTDTARLDLPEHLRLPGLAQVRTFTREDLTGWIATARRAAQWGPDQRNGCRRIHMGGRYLWMDKGGDAHSPDPWTPAEVELTHTGWHEHGREHRQDDQPSHIDQSALRWHRHGHRHRMHAPADVRYDGSHYWSWRSTPPLPPTDDLLTAAWSNPDLTDAQAHDLLQQAESIPRHKGDQVEHITWLAHVLSRHTSPNLTSLTHTWVRLLLG